MRSLPGMVTFGLGATLCTYVLRRLSQGETPDAREIVKNGVRTWLMLRGAAEDAQRELDEFRVEHGTPSAARPAGPRRRITIAPPA